MALATSLSCHAVACPGQFLHICLKEVMCGMGTQEPIDEAARCSAVERSGALGRRGDNELQRITDLAASQYDTTFACVSILTGKREVLLSRCAVPFWDTPRSESFCAVTIQRPGEPLIVRDAAKDPRFAQFEVVRFPPHVKFYAGMPLMSRDGYMIGALCVADPAARLETAIEITPLVLLAREVELALWR